MGGRSQPIRLLQRQRGTRENKKKGGAGIHGHAARNHALEEIGVQHPAQQHQEAPRGSGRPGDGDKAFR